MEELISAPTKMITTFVMAQTISFVVVMCVGFGFAFLGYKLFSKGFETNEGEITAEIGEWKIYLRKIGPGVFFAVFGASIIIALFVAGVYDAKNAASAAIEETKKGANIAFEKDDEMYKRFITASKIHNLIQKMIDGKALSKDEKWLVEEWLRIVQSKEIEKLSNFLIMPNK